MAEALVWCVCNERRFYGACARGASMVRVPVAWSRAGCPNENPRWCQVGTKIQVGTEHWNPTKYDPPVELQYHAPHVFPEYTASIAISCHVVCGSRPRIQARVCVQLVRARAKPSKAPNCQSASSFYTMQLSRARKGSMLKKLMPTESQHAAPWEEGRGGSTPSNAKYATWLGFALHFLCAHCTSSASPRYINTRASH